MNGHYVESLAENLLIVLLLAMLFVSLMSPYVWGYLLGDKLPKVAGLLILIASGLLLAFYVWGALENKAAVFSDSRHFWADRRFLVEVTFWFWVLGGLFGFFGAKEQRDKEEEEKAKRDHLRRITHLSDAVHLARKSRRNSENSANQKVEQPPVKHGV